MKVKVVMSKIPLQTHANTNDVLTVLYVIHALNPLVWTTAGPGRDPYFISTKS